MNLEVPFRTRFPIPVVVLFVCLSWKHEDRLNMDHTS